MSQRLTRNHYSRTYAGGESSRVREIPIKLDYNTHSNDDDARVRGKSSKTLNGSSYSRNSEARSNNSTPYKDYLKKSENIGTYNSQHDDNDTLVEKNILVVILFGEYCSSGKDEGRTVHTKNILGPRD